MFSRKLVVMIALLLIGNSGVAYAQQSATLSGEVTDDSGLVIPGARITASNNATGAEVSGSTNNSGEYELTVEAGTYTVTAENPGFEIGIADGVEAVAGESVQRNFTLALAAVTESIVVVGSRAEPRSVTESTVPVDVISTQNLSRQGSRDLVTQLRTVVPSFNINTQPISDAATVVRPANLRNLAPDHTLVLVNGKRRHRASVITWLGNGIADGSQGPDISIIPSIAIRQVEVLRDGAAAQYGSDAIAGVMNFQLKDDPSGGSLEVQTGGFRDANNGNPATCGAGVIGDIQHSCNGIGGHGRTLSLAGNVGVPLGENGFGNFSLEYGTAEPTNRTIQRQDALNIINAGNTNIRDPAQVWGSPRVNHDLKLFANVGHLFDDKYQLYGHGNYASRKVTGGFYFRNPHTRGGVFRGPLLEDGNRGLLVGDRVWAETAPESREPPPGREPGAGGCPIIPVVDHVPDAAALAAVEADPNCFTLYSRFPGGFTPQFGGDLIDYSVVGGLRGFASNGFTWDASASFGVSEIDQFINDTVNASLGFDTPTMFRPGIYRQEETNLNFDISYPVSDMVHFAAGTEWRKEEFTIGAGDDASWTIGPYAAQGFSSGSNGFNGYRADTTAGVWDRTNVAVYGDVEFSDAGNWTLGTALRFERFNDFGSTLNGKVSGRVQLNDVAALRAAFSTGFRAPTPGQQNAFNVTTAFIGGQLTNQGVVPATSAVAMARGGGQLQPEKSKNYSAGVVLEEGPFTFTADYFRVDIDDRVALAQEISLTDDEIETLLAEGIPEARNFPVFRFFLNDFSTTTQGIDLISTLVQGRTTISAVYNYTDTEVKNVESAVIDEFRIQTLERGLPNTRWSFSVNHDARRWNLMGRVNYFGQFWDSEDGRNAADLGVVASSAMYPSYSGKALLDIELGIPIGENVAVAIGGENILNTYPDVNEYGAFTVGNSYGQFSPFGFNGANFYVRVNYGWGLSRPSPERSSRDDESPQDPLRVRKEVAEQIAKLEELHDELIGQLKEIQESQTDLWLQRWAGEQVAKAQMAKERDMAMLRTSFERRTSAQDVEPLGKSAEIKQLAVKDQIAAAHLQKKGQPALSLGG
ncbi:MAG: TonB-dependent receptor [Acidobacteriia bacterium]|nr:TonB-dependent receptor [Terriglobia bacterium]